MMAKSFGNTVSLICMALLFFSTGCSGALFKNYGGITPNAAAAKAFEAYQLDSRVNYYISGSDVYPNALMGLNKTYTLVSDLWKKIEPTPQEFWEIIQRMQTKALERGQHQHGFAMLDDQGHPIGVWYSLLSVRTAIQMKGEGKVVILTPDLNTYERHDLKTMDSIR